MAQHVISINPFGEINHTLKDNVLKLTIGKREIKRMSEIKHDKTMDMFYVQRMDGRPFVMERINHELSISYKGIDYDDLYTENCFGCIGIDNATGLVPMWTTYDEAVAFEVRLINAYRLKGLPIPGFDPK